MGKKNRFAPADENVQAPAEPLQVMAELRAVPLLFTPEERRLQIRLLNELFGFNPETMSREQGAKWLTDLGDAMGAIMDDATAYVTQCIAKREEAMQVTPKAQALKAKLAEIEAAKRPRNKK